MWLSVKPNLRCTKFAEIKEVLEAKRAEAEAKIAAEKTARKTAEAINTRLEQEKFELEKSLAGGANALKDVETKVTKIESAKRQLESELSSSTGRLHEEEETNNQLSNSVKKMGMDLKHKKEDMELMELRLVKTGLLKMHKSRTLRMS